MRHAILILDRYLTGLSWALATALLAIISCLGLWQVAARFILSQPSVWTEEVMRRLLIWCVMFGVVVALRQGVLVCVDLALRVTHGRWHQTVRLFVALVTGVFLATVCWYGISLAWRVRFQTFASLDISMAWAYAAMPVGAGLAIVAVIANYIAPPETPDALAASSAD